MLVLKGGGGGTVGGPEEEKSPELFDLVPDSELEDIEDSDDDDLFALALDTNNKRKYINSICLEPNNVSIIGLKKRFPQIL